MSGVGHSFGLVTGVEAGSCSSTIYIKCLGNDKLLFTKITILSEHSESNIQIKNFKVLHLVQNISLSIILNIYEI